jgi:septum formation protein
VTAPLVGEAARTTRLVLASASAIRASLLRRAGLPIEVMAADADEASVKQAMHAERADAAACATALAVLKAQRVSARQPGALVIGADQMLECDGVWFDKPADHAAAAATLRALRGKTHRLVAAVAVVRDGACLWQYAEPARLTMRALSDGFIEAYLGVLGPAALQSVGAYQLEGLGVQLFSYIDGDHFTILGLPLLKLLEFLRRHAIVST